VQAQHIYLAELVVKFQSCLSLGMCHVWPTVGMWPCRLVVLSDVVVFHNDIGAFVSILTGFLCYFLLYQLK
jgi:hypothetical protein